MLLGYPPALPSSTGVTDGALAECCPPSPSSPGKKDVSRLPKSPDSTKSSHPGGGASGARGGGESAESSPAAATTLRPRFGKEYQRVDRRHQQQQHHPHHRLIENNNAAASPSPSAMMVPPPVNASTPLTTSSTTTTSSSVFTFDVASMTSRMSFVNSDCSGTDTDSPRSPSVLLRPAPAPMTYSPTPVYMNIGFPNPRSASPVVVEARSGSAASGAYSYSQGAEQANALLNYAEIDLRHTNGGSSHNSSGDANESSNTPIRHKRPPQERVEYAMIDMVATAAATRVGKEHAREREDSLRRNGLSGAAGSLRRSDSEGWRRRGNTPTPRTPTNKSGSGSSGKSGTSSKDRKFSSPM